MTPRAPRAPRGRPPARRRRPLLVVGLGNPLRGDDGVGEAVVARLDALGRAGIETALVQAPVPELAETASRCRGVVFVDASVALAPGEIRTSRLTPDRTAASFSHELSPRGVLAIAEVLYGSAPPAWLVEIGAEGFDGVDTLSPAARGAVGEVVAAVAALAGVG